MQWHMGLSEYFQLGEKVLRRQDFLPESDGAWSTETKLQKVSNDAFEGSRGE